MAFFKTSYDGYITGCGVGGGKNAITETEYSAILTAIRNMPTATDGYGYRLREDLTWELYDLPPVVLSDDDELSTEEVMDILLGGAV